MLGKSIDLSALLCLLGGGVMLGLAVAPGALPHSPYCGLTIEQVLQAEPQQQSGTTLDDVKALAGGASLSIGAVIVLLARMAFKHLEHRREHDKVKAQSQSEFLLELHERLLKRIEEGRMGGHKSDAETAKKSESED